jgi:hypothetical protein
MSPGRVRMFAGEFEGELQCSHIGFRADVLRARIGDMFRGAMQQRLAVHYKADFSSAGLWKLARKAGWRIVPVGVEKIATNRAIKRWLKAADARQQ